MLPMRVSSFANESRGEYTATWILLTDSPDFFTRPEVISHARPPMLKPGLRLWTDDYSALLPLIRW